MDHKLMFTLHVKQTEHSDRGKVTGKSSKKSTRDDMLSRVKLSILKHQIILYLQDVS